MSRENVETTPGSHNEPSAEEIRHAAWRGWDEFPPVRIAAIPSTDGDNQ